MQAGAWTIAGGGVPGATWGGPVRPDDGWRATVTSAPPLARSTGARFGALPRFFRPYWKRVVLTIVAILLTAGIGLINPILLKLIIDDAIPSRDLGKLYLYVGLMVALPIVSGLIGVGQTYLNTIIGQRVMRDLRDAL
ncbi:MAG: hypothetical protein KatS3mg059_1582 [Thermomicrobiales bacterium]|nr:MAG: hypothetical protein KatS3mg059_1582 [Thermomicrobiales bacterium]